MKIKLNSGESFVTFSKEELEKMHAINSRQAHLINKHLNEEGTFALYQFISEGILNYNFSENGVRKTGLIASMVGLNLTIISLNEKEYDAEFLKETTKEIINVIRQGVELFILEILKLQVEGLIDELGDPNDERIPIKDLTEEFDEKTGAKLIKGLINVKDIDKLLSEEGLNTIVDEKRGIVVSTNGKVENIEYNEDGYIESVTMNGMKISGEELRKLGL